MKRNDEEHRIQAEAVKHARQRWPICRTNLFAIPNGGARDPVTGARLKAEGVLPGVFDLFFAAPTVKPWGPDLPFDRGIHGLWIEVKTPRGKLSPAQLKFKINVERCDYITAICRSTQEILDTIEEYLEG